MFKNLLIKWKLATLVVIMLIALAAIGASGYRGIAKVGSSVDEIGKVRLPSLLGLLAMSEAQTDIMGTTLRAAIWETNYQAQQQFAGVLKEREAAWKDAEAGWKKYEPLPQTAEEAVLWKRFVGEWEAWKAQDAKLAATVAALAAASSEEQQKTLFTQFYAQYEAAGPLYQKAKATLGEICDLNDRVAADSVNSGVEAASSAENTMIWSALAAMATAVAFAWYIANAITKPIQEAVRVAQTVASGDLRSTIVVETSEETGQLMQALKNMNDSLKSIVGQVRTGTDAIACASAQIATGNMDLSSRTEEQASSLEETASSMEEMTSTVRQNAHNAQQANQLAFSASEVAEKGGGVVARVVETMESINTSSGKIVDIISVIDGIAFQTNILALNAAVEAARAGEQGRGFAVVASEVRNLAQRSAAAAKEIKQLITDSVETVAGGSRLVAEAGQTMDEVVQSVQRVNDIMSEISTATQEQSSGIDQINIAIGQMDNVTQQNAALVEEAAAATAALQHQAAALAEVVSVFQLDQAVLGVAPVRPAARPQPVAAASKAEAPAPKLAQPRRGKAEPLLRPAPRKEAVAAAASADEWEEF
ncbi:methyl-accepting chemotaxis protein [Massilia endophytica]|uniref:methyl-accepting chemotaxis protein n=1 Tax=Massilia endophytica TaxID=2899220 RepID=UPI001E485CD5|nr:methyl-accepting chemotaxis protein [Massilia endophytica]UGQ48405.1 methyl-accepting chemotaxis protein [Massilia endophytica]